MYLIVGLGNPGAQYERNRHNVGFLALDYLVGKHGSSFKFDKYHKSETCQLRIGKSEVLLMKPQTFMNLSGEALSRLKKEVPVENVVVLYDDLDLSFGRIRVKGKGSAGTHNGMKSIISHLGSDKFPRVRIGIRTQHPVSNLKSFVLSDFPQAQIDVLEQEVFPGIEECLELITSSNLSKASQKFNKKEKDEQ